ncbi:hypothetical protein AMTRI_Chr05g73930 [Amborella trichopoda]
MASALVISVPRSITLNLWTWVHQRKLKRDTFWVFLRACNRRMGIISWCNPSPLNDGSVFLPKKNQLDYNPSEDLLGLEGDPPARSITLITPEPRSWFGPNGQYVRELPCPNCRGRGYTPCSACGIDRSRLGCSQCNGKGMRTCLHCSGDRVIWEESIDEVPWEKARSSSPLKLKEDDEVDNLDIKLAKTRSKRVYASLSPEVRQKIRRSLKVSQIS